MCAPYSFRLQCEWVSTSQQTNIVAAPIRGTEHNFRRSLPDAAPAPAERHRAAIRDQYGIESSVTSLALGGSTVRRLTRGVGVSDAGGGNASTPLVPSSTQRLASRYGRSRPPNCVGMWT